jgi:Large polyvalent protein-associated domain 1
MAKEAEGQGAAGKDDFITENPDLLPAGELRDAVINLRKAMLDGPHYATVVEKYSARDYQMAKHNIDGVTFASSFATKIKAAGNVHDAVKAVEALGMAGVRGKPTPKQVKRIRDWRNIAIAYHGGNPAGGEVAVRAGRPMSSFALEARILDQGGKDYWAATHEMSARAFQSWVEDRLADQGRKNDYLSSYADNRYHVDPLTGMQWKPYPEGEERTRINEAFDRLVAAVKTSDTLAKALAMI